MMMMVFYLPRCEEERCCLSLMSVDIIEPKVRVG